MAAVFHSSAEYVKASIQKFPLAKEQTYFAYLSLIEPVCCKSFDLDCLSFSSRLSFSTEADNIASTVTSIPCFDFHLRN